MGRIVLSTPHFVNDADLKLENSLRFQLLIKLRF